MQQFADSLNYSKAQVAAWESGDRLPQPKVAKLLDDRFKPLITFTELLATLREALVAPHMRDLLPHEKKAVRIQQFNSTTIPGLLQTEAYARELMSRGMPHKTQEEIEIRVEARISRSEVLSRESPALYCALIHEAALMCRLATPGAMLEQLHILEQYALRNHVTLHIYPMSRGIYSMMGGSLDLLTLKDGRTIAMVESFGGGESIVNPQKVAFYSEMFDVARTEALPPDESLEVIRQYAKEYEND